MYVRSDEKTARRAVVLARNADKHGRARDARPKPFFKKKFGMRPFAAPPGPFPPAMAIWIISHLSIYIHIVIVYF